MVDNMTSPNTPIRSPSYPNMALRDAIVAIGKIEKPYRSSPVDRLNAAKLIGYTSLSGPANKALAALAAYGLLDRAGKGEARVTERARDILHADSESQRLARLMEAAMEPPLFRELRERFQGVAIPRLDGGVTYLNRQGFNPTAVRPAAKAFLETMGYLEELGATDSHGVALGGEAETVDDTKRTENAMNIERTTPRAVPAIPQLKSSLLQEVFNIDEGPVTLTFPARLSAASYEDLEDHLQIFLRKAKRRAEALRQANIESGDPDSNEIG